MEPGERVILRFGGGPDEVSVTFAVYGDDLDPADLTAALGTAPCQAFRRGEPHPKPHSRPARVGGWFLNVRGRDPELPEDLVARVLDRLPPPAIAADVFARRGLDVQLRFGLFLTRWNSMFTLSTDCVQRVAAYGAAMVYDIYADDGDDDEPLPGVH